MGKRWMMKCMLSRAKGMKTLLHFVEVVIYGITTLTATRRGWSSTGTPRRLTSCGSTVPTCVRL